MSTRSRFVDGLGGDQPADRAADFELAIALVRAAGHLGTAARAFAPGTDESERREVGDAALAAADEELFKLRRMRAREVRLPGGLTPDQIAAIQEECRRHRAVLVGVSGAPR